MDDHPADQATEEPSDKSHLDAAPSTGPSCRAEMRVEVALSFASQKPYPALIEWSMSDNYPISADEDGTCGPVVGLYDGEKKLIEKKCDSRKSTIPWPTGIPFAPVIKLNARIYDWDCKSKSRFLLCKTRTPSSPTDRQSCQADMSVEVTDLLKDPKGNAQVHYKISENYPTSTNEDGTCGPTLALYLGDEELDETSPLYGEGDWYTFEPFREGLNARLSDWDCMSKKDFPLCQTDPVP